MSFLWTLSGIRTPLLDTIFQLITFLAQELVIIAVICALYWCIDKKLAVQIGFNYLCAGLLVQSLKITFRIPRPWVLDSEFKAVESAIPAATGYSFPSGHTQSGTSLFATLAINAEKWYWKCIFVLTFLLIGFSRMYLGCHTPTDVITAMVISLFFAWFTRKYLERFTSNSKWTGIITLIIILAAALVCIQSAYLYRNQTIEYRYVTDCFKASGAALGFAAGWYLENKTLRFSPKANNPSRNVLLLRYVVGLALTVVLKLVLKILLGSTLIGEMIQYGIIIFWVIFVYPWIFSRKMKYL